MNETTFRFENDFALENPQEIGEFMLHAFSQMVDVKFEQNPYNDWPLVKLEGHEEGVKFMVEEYWGEDCLEQVVPAL